MKLLIAAVLIISDFSFCVKVDQPSSVFSREGAKAVTLQCNHDDNSYYYMFWYRQRTSGEMQLLAYSINTNISAIEPPFTISKYTLSRPVVLHSSLQIHSVGAADSAVYYCASKDTVTVTLEVKLTLEKGQNSLFWVHCDSGGYEAHFGGGTKLTVLEDGIKITPPTVTLLRPSKKECRDPRDNQRKKTLVCVASGFYPDHVTVRWKFNGRDETDNVATDAAAVKKGNFYSITSRFRVSADDWFNPDNKFTCIVSFYDSSNHIIKEAFLHGDKQVNIFMSFVVLNTFNTSILLWQCQKYMMISQRAKLSYGVFIVKSCMYGAFAAFLVWKLQGSAGK
ncbi:hypothetical protein Q8A73_017832 [Channa argus]|nr:hypothetical protein Q8A73_017832 [Channa argus]